ncbi:MAG: energy transducer TonB family protein [Stenotrophobium sp.]
MTPARTRSRWSLGLALAVHLLLLLVIGLSVMPRGAAGPGGEGVGLEMVEGNADVDDSPALSLPALPTPPAAAELPKPLALAAAPVASKIFAQAAETQRMQLQPGGTPGGDLFLARVRAHLARYRRSLPPALRDVRGTVLLKFTLAPDGTVSGVAIAASSGTAALDREALDLLTRAQPLPARPATVTLAVPIEFGNVVPN